MEKTYARPERERRAEREEEELFPAHRAGGHSREEEKHRHAHARHRVLLAHGAIVMSLSVLVLLVLDGVNSAMEFIGSTQGHWLLLLFAVVTLLNGISSSVYLSREKKHKRAKSGSGQSMR